jgi:hypothetical protein
VSQKSANDGNKHEAAAEKPSVTLPGTLEKIISPPFPGVPEKAQIGVDGAEDLYREIRVENTVNGPDGEELALKEGAEVDVTIEVQRGATTLKKAANSGEPAAPRRG